MSLEDLKRYDFHGRYDCDGDEIPVRRIERFDGGLLRWKRS